MKTKIVPVVGSEQLAKINEVRFEGTSEQGEYVILAYDCSNNEAVELRISKEGFEGIMNSIGVEVPEEIVGYLMNCWKEKRHIRNGEAVMLQKAELLLDMEGEVYSNSKMQDMQMRFKKLKSKNGNYVFSEVERGTAAYYTQVVLTPKKAFEMATKLHCVNLDELKRYEMLYLAATDGVYFTIPLN